MKRSGGRDGRKKRRVDEERGERRDMWIRRWVDKKIGGRGDR
jgi:hypothetical protein